MLRSLLRAITTFLLVAILVARFGFPALLASEISSMYLVERTNEERSKRGASPLKYNKKLENAAFLKAENMFKEQYWAHYGPNNESPWQFILQSGYSYTYAGENLAKGFTTSQGVHDAWMASPTHRDNILDPQFSEIGIAVVRGNLLGSDVYLVVQMFGNTGYEEDTDSSQDPLLKITNPENGDILEDGIKDVRGIVQNIDEETGVTIYIDDAFQGRAKLEDDEFIISSLEGYGVGQKEITARAQGKEDELLLDSVQVTVHSKVNNDGELEASCFSAEETLTDVQIGYYCEGKSRLVGQFNQITYEPNENDVIEIPKAVISSVDSEINLFVTNSNGDTSSITVKLGDIGYNDDAKEKSRVTLGTVSFRSIIQIGFVLALLVLILYSMDLFRKHQILEHKHELMSVILLLSILFIAFNFGFVRV